MDALTTGEEEETDVLKLEHEIAGIDRDTIRYKQELSSLKDNFKVESEALEHVQDRVTSVTSELNAVMSIGQTETTTEVRELGTLASLVHTPACGCLATPLEHSSRLKAKGCSATSRTAPRALTQLRPE